MIGYKTKREVLFEGIDLDSFNKEEYIKRFDAVTVPGIYVMVAIYKKPIETKTKSGIYLPSSAVEEDEEYASSVGLFVKQGNEAYVGSQFPTGSYAKVGDWVLFNRGSCMQGSYDGLPYIITEAHKIRMVVDDPRKIGR